MNTTDTGITNDAIQNILTRSSIRQFTDQPLTEAQIHLLLQAAMSAPSAVNKQPWDFVVVTDHEVAGKMVASIPNAHVALKAPVSIVVCGDMSKTLSADEQGFWIQDASAASENLLLAAHAMGLGAVWCGIYPIAERVDDVQKALDLPSHIIPLNIVPVGYPAQEGKVKDKFKAENIHFNRW